MKALGGLWRDNPVLVKELRTRMRGSRAYWILTGYLGFLSVILFFVYRNWWAMAQGGGLSASSRIGQQFFGYITGVQAFLVAFITPAITAGAITIEREQRTIEMLELSRLSRGAIIAGKLMSAMAFVGLLLFSSVPLSSICFFLGGIAPEQVGYTYAMLFAGSFVAGGLGLAWSSIARTTAAAITFTYATLILAPILFGVLFGMVLGPATNGMPLIEISVGLIVGLYGLPSPTGNFGPAYEFFLSSPASHLYGIGIPSWIGPVVSYGFLGTLLCALAASRIESYPERKAALLRGLSIGAICLQCLLLFGARFYALTPSAPPGAAQAVANHPLISLLVYPVLLLLIIGPMFVTGALASGDIASLGQRVVEGWSPRHLFTGSLFSGGAFLVATVLGIVGLYLMSFVFIHKPGAALHGSAALAGSMVNPGSGIIQVTIATGACVLGLWALGVFCSALTRNRWASLGLVYAFMLTVLLAPTVAMMQRQSNPNYVQGLNGSVEYASASMAINLAYFNPVISVLEAAGNGRGAASVWPLTAFTGSPVWAVTTLSYTVLAVVCLLACIPLVRREQAKSSRHRPAMSRGE